MNAFLNFSQPPFNDIVYNGKNLEKITRLWPMQFHVWYLFDRNQNPNENLEFNHNKLNLVHPFLLGLLFPPLLRHKCWSWHNLLKILTSQNNSKKSFRVSHWGIHVPNLCSPPSHIIRVILMLVEFHILYTCKKSSMAYTISKSSPNSWVESWKYNFLMIGGNHIYQACHQKNNSKRNAKPTTIDGF